jgi:hypothetical protein
VLLASLLMLVLLLASLYYFWHCGDIDIIPHTCCTYVDTPPSLPILKYTVVARLLTCLHLSTSGDPAFDFTCGDASQHVISTHAHIFEYKAKHLERQRVLPAFAHALSCTRLQWISRPHSFPNGGKNEDRDHRDQHVAHVAFKIPDFWPHDPNTWFRKIERKFRICKIKQFSTKYDHLLSALSTDICSSINDSLAEIDENADDQYEQLKELLMTRYTIDRWARAFKLHKFLEIGDKKPAEVCGK